MRKRAIWDYIVITAGILLTASAVYFFMMPLSIVMGSISGLALILSQVARLPVSVILLILNIVCLLLGFFLLGREFGVKTTYVSLLFPAALGVFERVFPDNPSLTGDVILDVLCMVIVVSAGQALLFRVNASSGGLDILAKIINKYTHIELGKILAFLGVVTVLCSVFVYDTKTVIVGLLGTYFNGIVVDSYLAGFAKKKRVCIMSEHHEEIRQYILTGIHRGVTLYPAKGGYRNKDQVELVTILNKSEYGLLMNYIREVDETAFVTVSAVSEIAGIWNIRGETRLIR